MVLMTLFQSSNGEIDIEKRLMDMGGGEEGDGEMYGESNIEIYNVMCKTESQWEFAVRLRKLKQGLYDDLEVWDREGDAREIWEGGDMDVPMHDYC